MKSKSANVSNVIPMFNASSFESDHKMKCYNLDLKKEVNVYLTRDAEIIRYLSNSLFDEDSVYYGCTGVNRFEAYITTDSIFFDDPEQMKDLNCLFNVADSIPARVTALGTSTFNACSSLRKISLHEGLLSIGDSCFRECTSLREITIPSTVQTIGAKAFEYDTTMNGSVKVMLA